jgi:hypothetical protein
MRKQSRGIESWQWGIQVIHDQRDLGAPEYNRVAASILHLSDDTLKVHNGLGCENAIDQLIHDEAINFFAFGGVWTHIRQAPFHESIWIDIALYEPASSRQADAPEPALDGLC